MSELSIPLRTQLGKTIVEARRIAEGGACKALQSLAVEWHEPHSSMSIEERVLRNRLRARGRQLGDVRDKQRGAQSIGRLTHEVAYEHWHRMLFARFLAENELLIHPEHNVAVSLEDVVELALETGEDPHQMAARFAQEALPQIFRTGDPVLEVKIAPETRQALEKLLDGLPVEVFTADDSLGWTYQYWQVEKKNAVNKSGERISADEMPAVTQLFTEHYMVVFLYHNTIGAWHAGKVLADNPHLAKTAQSEEELRSAVEFETAAGQSTFDYLRFIREPKEGDKDDNPTGLWRPAAGVFEGWPKTAKGIKVIDPCCGSGHFLVAGFKQLVRLRIHEEGLDVDDAVRAVLTDNIYGLELDSRCTQIAAFNLAMAAWKLVKNPIELPALHIACSGLALGSTKTEWTRLAGDSERLHAGMEQLYGLFEQAPEIGSLIDPKAIKSDLLVADFSELQPLLDQALARETDNIDDTERSVAAQGMARAADLLSGDYTLVITNPPYLLRGKQPEVLQAACERYYAPGATDLATVFLERCSRLCHRGGTHATVTPQNWLFLGSYEELRRDLLARHIVHVTKIGSGATATASWDVLRALAIVNVEKSNSDYLITGFEALDSAENQRAAWLRVGNIFCSSQSLQLANPDARISLPAKTAGQLLRILADSLQGTSTGDKPRFVVKFWEVMSRSTKWAFWQSRVKFTVPYSGREHRVFWEGGQGSLKNSPKSAIRGTGALGKLVSCHI